MNNFRLSTIVWLGLTTFLLGALGHGLGDAVSPTAMAQEATPPISSPGLLTTLTNADGQSLQQVESHVAFRWVTDEKIQRLAGAPQKVSWQGQLNILTPGNYRLALRSEGNVQLRLADREVPFTAQAGSAWKVSEPLTLDAEDYAFLLTATVPENRAEGIKAQLYWSGPGFRWEMTPPKYFSHQAQQPSLDTLQEQGEQLAMGLRCAACHREPQANLPKEVAPRDIVPAPSLVHAASYLHADWVRSHLQATKPTVLAVKPPGEEADDADEEMTPQEPAPMRRMPFYGLSAEDAHAITAALLTADGATNLPPHADLPAKPAADKLKKGEELFASLGCLACHRWQGLGQMRLWDGGDLSLIAQKRPPSFFSAWLSEPQKVNADHRMPLMELSDAERESLSIFLGQQHGTEPNLGGDLPINAEVQTRGRVLIQQQGCAACHELPHSLRAEVAKDVNPRNWQANLLSSASNWEKACSAERSSAGKIAFHLLPGQQKSLQAYFSEALPQTTLKARGESGKVLLQALGCIACHARDEFPAASGQHAMVGQALSVTKKYPQLAERMAHLVPPSLASCGDKLEDRALETAIRRKGPAYRDYLLVRMPRFTLSDTQTKAIIDYLILSDRLPELPPTGETPPSADADPASPTELAQHRVAGTRLVSSSGFGCTSCHQVGSVLPAKSTAAARGPQLVGIDDRLRRMWFDRWVRNPSRIVPRMEMPSVALPVAGVLDQKLDKQLAAVWLVLNTPGFEPPISAPVRVLRHSGLSPQQDIPWVLTDVLKLPDRTLTRPFAVGFGNRHNLAYDHESGTIAGWWLGDFAQQITQGKTWSWQPGGGIVGSGAKNAPAEMFLVHPQLGKLNPFPAPQFFSVPQSWQTTKEGKDGASALLWEREFHFAIPAGDAKEPSLEPVFVQERLQGIAGGFSREIVWKAKPSIAASKLVFAPWAGLEKDQKVSSDGRTLRIGGEGGLQVRIAAPEDLRFQPSGMIELVLESPPRLVLHYQCDVQADTLPAAVVTADVVPEGDVPLRLGPGLVAKRLPLPGEIMPTGLAFTKAGDLLFCTLKGEAYRASLSAQDGKSPGPLPLVKLAEGLPAPYGIAAQGDEVDVLTKPALLRLHPAPSGTQKISSLCSDWGYTTDYHDWAVGLLKEPDGSYVVGLPSQQDERSPAAARHRGQCVRLTLTPEKPTSTFRQGPLYRLEEITRGHRFPMGLARIPGGAIFVTDNQGNFNPYNELNHLKPGSHFGFINSLDRPAAKLHPPQVTKPAIEIPHPWTRSVNGICCLFMESDGVDLSKAWEKSQEHFGPFAGDLIGCEYDSRRLVRMSLDPIGDTFQGGVYPFSQVPDSLEEGLLGPLVAAVSPQGELIVGGIRDSGWGAGNNIGEIVSLRINADALPGGIRRIRPVKDGFEIEFLRPVDPTLAMIAGNYRIFSARRESTPAYGGPDLERRSEPVQKVSLAEDRLHVTLSLGKLREGFVYEFQLKNLMADGKPFFPAEGFYSLKQEPGN